MFELNLPNADIKITSKNGKPFVWDQIRKKWLFLTPEEYVRQHFLHFLIKNHGYPASRMSVEKGVKVNEMGNRSDIVIYNQHATPYILVECKSPSVKITQGTLEQASRYNLKLKAEILCVTNGLVHLYFKINFQNQTYEQLQDLPYYQEADKQDLV